MSRKHLRDLLMEDQEPFHLKTYIADRRCQIQHRPSRKSNLNKIQTNSSRINLCRHACFLSFQDSPDVRKSPFPSPVKSPCRSPIFLQIPSRTAAMLLEAAARIQKNSSVKSKSSNVGLFGSFLKKFKYKNRIKMSPENQYQYQYQTAVEISCSCRRSSAATSTSSSPTSPFRFSLQKPPSSGHQTPEFQSPASSPVHPSKQEGDNINSYDSEKVEEEEKEQCSPVSVLDPPFADDEIEHYEEEDGADDYDLECSFAIVQKVKEQLLNKLRRFERLAELDPVELEKRMCEEQDDVEDEEDLTNVTEAFSDEDEEEDMDIVKAVYGKTCSNYTNNLVLDLVYEEKKNGAQNNEIVVNRVCKRLDSWKEVESNTIDMMVELDFRREVEGWKRCDQEQMRETVMEIELGIFGVLIDDLSEELGFLLHGNF